MRWPDYARDKERGQEGAMVVRRPLTGLGGSSTPRVLPGATAPLRRGALALATGSGVPPMRPFWIDDPQGKTATAVDESICPVRPIDPPFGRRFHPRCPRAQVFSAAKDPACGNAGLGHIVHCLYPVERWPLDDPTDLARIESIPAVTRSWT